MNACPYPRGLLARRGLRAGQGHEIDLEHDCFGESAPVIDLDRRESSTDLESFTHGAHELGSDAVHEPLDIVRTQREPSSPLDER